MISRTCRRVGIALAELVLLSATCQAGNSDFSAGVAFGRHNGSVTKNEMDKAGNNIGDYVPEFDRDKAEQQYGDYYGGVTSSGKDMNAPGSEQLNSTTWGQAIQEHKRKAPDMPGVSAGDDFLKQGQKAIDNAQSMFDPNLCKKVSFDRITTVKKSCERDLDVLRKCQRIPVVTWVGEIISQEKTIVLRVKGRGPDRTSGKKNFYLVSIPEGGQVIRGKAAYVYDAAPGDLSPTSEYVISVMGVEMSNQVNRWSGFGPLPNPLVAGESIEIGLWYKGSPPTWGDYTAESIRKGWSVSIELTISIPVNTLDAVVTWVDTCKEK